MKPTAPLLALPCSRMKPSSPLRAMKGHYWAISTLQRCCRFQGGAQRGLQRCCWFQGGAQCVVQRCWWFQSCLHRVLCAKKFALRGPEWVCARKSSPCKPKTGEKCCFQACWANFFADEPLKALCRASFFADEPLKAIMGNVSMCVRSPCGASHQPGRNFACNSPQGMSHHELKSLRFCRFAPRVDAGSAGIACDFCGAGELCFEHWLDDGFWAGWAALTYAAVRPVA